MRTPISKARNLGPVTSAELQACGIETLEALRELGWEEALARMIERDPKWINLNLAYGLIGAITDTHWREVAAEEKSRARRMLARYRSKS